MSARADLLTPCHQCGHERAWHSRGRCEWTTWAARGRACACDEFLEGDAA